MSHWIYPLFVQKFGATQKKFMLIPHRQKRPVDALLMIDKIEQRVKKAVREGMLFSGVYDEIIKSISHEGYLYNKDCFVGIDFMNGKIKDNQYEFDEVLFKQSGESAINYFNSVVDVYNPLFVFNPFGERDDEGFNKLHLQINERTMLGCIDHHNDHTHAVSVVISKMNKKTPFTEEHEKVFEAHKKGLKYILVCHDSFSSEYVARISREVKPDFIETRQPLKHLEEQG